MNNKLSKNKHSIYNILLVFLYLFILVNFFTGCASKLSRMVSKGNEDAINQHLKKNFFPKEYLYDPLIQAIRKGNPNIVELLIENGADVNYYKKTGALETFLTNPIKNIPPVFEAIKSGNMEIFKILIKNAADLSIRISVDKRISQWPNLTILEYCAIYGRKNIIEYLINFDLIFYLPDYKEGGTRATSIALFKGYPEIAEFLYNKIFTIPSEELPRIHCQEYLWMASINGTKQNPWIQNVNKPPGLYVIDIAYYHYVELVMGWKETKSKPIVLILYLKPDILYYIYPEYFEGGKWEPKVKEIIIKH